MNSTERKRICFFLLLVDVVVQLTNQDLSETVVAILVFLRGNTVLFRVVPQFMLSYTYVGYLTAKAAMTP